MNSISVPRDAAWKFGMPFFSFKKYEVVCAQPGVLPGHSFGRTASASPKMWGSRESVFPCCHEVRNVRKFELESRGPLAWHGASFRKREVGLLELVLPGS